MTLGSAIVIATAWSYAAYMARLGQADAFNQSRKETRWLGLSVALPLTIIAFVLSLSHP